MRPQPQAQGLHRPPPNTKIGAWEGTAGAVGAEGSTVASTSAWHGNFHPGGCEGVLRALPCWVGPSLSFVTPCLPSTGEAPSLQYLSAPGWLGEPWLRWDGALRAGSLARAHAPDHSHVGSGAPRSAVPTGRWPAGFRRRGGPVPVLGEAGSWSSCWEWCLCLGCPAGPPRALPSHYPDLT